MLKKSKKKFLLAPFILLLLFLVTHLFGLTSLPVFADESIYIRWAQLIIDDPAQYLFFALNDGKTPLWIWAITPFQFLGTDQLWSGRIVAVIVGLLQVLLSMATVYKVSKSKLSAYIAGVLTTILPFWLLHHRLALIDGMMTLWVTLALFGTVTLDVKKSEKLIKLPSKTQTFSVLIIALGTGLGLWTKLPMLLALPGLIIWPLFFYKDKTILFRKFGLIGIGMFLGLLSFIALKIHPAFGQLFGRGSDFLYPISDVLSGKWRDTLPNVLTYSNYFFQYLTWPVLIFMLSGLFWPGIKRTVHALFWSGLLFASPIFMLGKVVYPRYLLPTALFFTLAASIVIGDIIQNWLKTKEFKSRVFFAVIITILLSQIVQLSAVTALTAMFNPAATPYVSADRTQYLTEWSSGHGIVETRDFIRKLSKDEVVAVGTEGYFGTLPDALLLYFHRQPLDSIYIEGIGWPVTGITQKYVQRAAEISADRYLLVVNSHRLEFPLDPDLMLFETCRPFNAPCLQVWDITTVVKDGSIPVKKD